MKQIRSILSVVAGSALTSLSPFFVQFSELDAIANSFYRMAIGGMILFAIALWKKEKFPQKKTVALCALGALVIGLDLIAWSQSTLYIGPGLSTILANLQIVFLVLIGALFLGETLSFQFSAMCALIAFGVWCLISPHLDGEAKSGMGIACAIAASFLYSLYLLILKVIQKDGYSPIVILSMVCTLGALFLALLIFLTPGSTLVLSTSKAFFCVLSNGIFSQVIGWLLIVRSIKTLPLSLTGLLTLTQPALAFLVDFSFFGRNGTWIQGIGCCLLLAAVYGAVWGENKRLSTAISKKQLSKNTILS